jgi:uncharacterized protein YkwD
MKQAFVTLCLIINSLNSLGQANWYSLNAFEFFRLKAAHEPINRAEPDYSLLEASLFHATNMARDNFNLPPLQWSGELTKAAQGHCKSMRKFNFFSHTNPRTRALKTPALRIKRNGGKFEQVAENIAMHPVIQLLSNNTAYLNSNGELSDKDGNLLTMKTYGELAQIVVGRWMDSKGHRQNILGPYQWLGCGVSQIYKPKGEQVPQILITQNFGHIKK